MMKEEERGELFQGFQEQFLMHHQYHQMQQNGLIFPPEVSPILQPWQTTSNFNPFSNPDPFLPPPPLPPPSSYASFFNNRSSSRNNPCLQFPYHELSSSNNLGIGQMNQPFGIQGEIISKMTAQEIMDAKALAASKSHSEAERRRRERINNHLAKLRSLLPSTTKTDKASLLAEVIQHVKELKRQTTLIDDISPLPTELDELSVNVDASDEDGKFVIKASLCCEDRTDLLPQIIKALKSLHLRTLKAEITTLGGRVKNVLFITGEDDDSGSGSGGGDRQEAQQQQYCISSIQEALKAVMEKVCGEDQSSSASIKRQRTNHNINIIENRSL